jgi:hypothetical protein
VVYHVRGHSLSRIGRAAPIQGKEDVMLKWIALAVALVALPSSSKALKARCTLPCGDHCPFPCKSCPLQK